MKKLVWLIVCLMTITISANAQDLQKIRQSALNEVKKTLIAPSKFVLTDVCGNKISINSLKVEKINGYEVIDSCSTYITSVVNDSIIPIITKRTYKPCYKVCIIGDAMNKMGGYEQIIENVYVTKHYIAWKKIPYDEEIISYKTIENFVFGEGKMPQVMPSYPSGMGALMQYLSSNIKYPAIAEENGIQGRVICTFIVERDGSITNVRVAKSVDPSLDMEAERIIKSMPNWTPAKHKGRYVRCKYALPITFRPS